MFDTFTELTGRDCVTSAYFCPVGRGESNKDSLALDVSEMKELGVLMQRKKAVKRGMGRCDFYGHYEREMPSGYRKTNCGLGSDVVSVAHDGSVYPCQWLHTEEFKAGNITQQRFAEIYYTSDVFRRCRDLRVDSTIEGCGECEVRYYCGGGCRALSLKIHGDIRAKCPFCDLHKDAAEKAIWGINY